MTEAASGFSPRLAQLVRRRTLDAPPAPEPTAPDASGGPRASLTPRRSVTNWLTPRASASHNIRKMAQEALKPSDVSHNEFEAHFNMQKARRGSIGMLDREKAAINGFAAMTALNTAASEENDAKGKRVRRTSHLQAAFAAMDAAADAEMFESPTAARSSGVASSSGEASPFGTSALSPQSVMQSAARAARASRELSGTPREVGGTPRERRSSRETGSSSKQAPPREDAPPEARSPGQAARASVSSRK
jgi:hypothetical protein